MLSTAWGLICHLAVSPEPPARCIIYIVRRTQIYLDDDLWNALRTRARSRKTAISALVREAVRARFLEEQARAMREFVGVRKGRSGPVDAVEDLLGLRRGERLARLNGYRSIRTF